MAYGRRDGFSYSDDVPIKISERVKIPPRISLPVSFQPSISLELLEDYDFSLEHQVLEFCETRRKAKEDEEKEKAEQVSREIEQFTKTLGVANQDPASNTNIPVHNAKDGAGTDEVPKSWQPTQILSPEPLVSNGKDNSDNISNIKKAINLEDFESQSGSPFDFVELQTINEIEELSNVFRGIVNPKPAVNESNDTNPKLSVDESKLSDRSLVSIPSFVSNEFDNYTNGASNSEDLTVSPPKTIPSSDLPLNYQTQGSISNSSYSSNIPPSYYSYTESNASSMGPNYSLSNGPRYTQYNFESNVEGYGNFPRLRSSKSTSDISIERDDNVAAKAKASLNWRSQTPPPSTICQASVTPTASGYRFTNTTNYSSQGSNAFVTIPKNSLDNTKPKTTHDYLPDPFDELDNEQKQFVTSLFDMGFPKDRAARAVKHLGIDDKKVLDHLCQVQSLVENGCEGIDAETALHLYDYNMDEAKKFLDLLVQFQDLGFNKDSARKALIRHKNDRDKALDSLLS